MPGYRPGPQREGATAMTPSPATATTATPARIRKANDPRCRAGRRAGADRPGRGRRAVRAQPRPRTGPGSDDLDRHAPNKAALLDGIAETILAQLKVDPADPDGPRSCAPSPAATARWRWPTRTRCRCWSPGRSDPPRAPPRRHPRPLEDILDLRTRAGFSGPDALHIYRALFGFLHGHVLNELQELIENPDETDDLLRLGLYRLPIREFPLLRSLAPPWPPTTAPPNSSAASTSSSPAWPTR